MDAMGAKHWEEITLNREGWGVKLIKCIPANIEKSKTCAFVRDMRAEQPFPMEGGSGGPPTEIFQKLDCKCCNQSYSCPLFVNKGGPGVHPWK